MMLGGALSTLGLCGVVPGAPAVAAVAGCAVTPGGRSPGGGTPGGAAGGRISRGGPIPAK